MKRGRKGHIITVYKGTEKEFTGNYVEIAEHFGLEYKTLYQRVKDSKLPHHTPECLEDAIEKIGYKNTFTVFKGTEDEFTGTYKEIAKHFNIEYYKIIQRIKSLGYTLEEAIRGSRRYHNKHTVYKDTDKEFTGTYTDIAKHFNISYGSLYKQIYSRQYQKIEDAIEYCLELKHIIYLPLDISSIGISKHEFGKLVVDDEFFNELYKNNSLHVVSFQDKFDPYTVRIESIVGTVKHIDFKRGKVKVYMYKEVADDYNMYKDDLYLLPHGVFISDADTDKIKSIKLLCMILEGIPEEM